LKEGNNHLNEEIPHEVLEEILERSDWDEDRMLTYEDFLKMVEAREFGAHRPRLHQLIRYAALAVVPRNQRQTVILRYLEHFSCATPPIFLLLISIIEIAVFVYYCVQLGDVSATGPVPFDSELIYNPHKRNEAWRFVSYALIHAGVLHLVFNLLVQLGLGIPLELVHKGWRIGLIYLAGVVAGSLGASISDPNSYLAGASGGVYALISAHMANVMLNWTEMEFNWIRLVGLIVFAGTDFGVAIHDRYFTEKKNRTSYAAHLAGAIAGLLVGIIALRNLRVRRWELVLGWFALVIYIMLMGSAIIFNVFYPAYFLQQYDE
jgi:rhomboid-related protein 1/2/3